MGLSYSHICTLVFHIRPRFNVHSQKTCKTLLLVSSPFGYYSPLIGKRQALFPKVKEFSSPQGCAAGGLRLHRKSPLDRRGLFARSRDGVWPFPARKENILSSMLLERREVPHLSNWQYVRRPLALFHIIFTPDLFRDPETPGPVRQLFSQILRDTVPYLYATEDAISSPADSA
jgi:hypothetical protein